MKEKDENMMFKEEGKTMSSHKVTKSHRFEFPKLSIN